MNTWLNYVKFYREKNRNLSYKESLLKAKKSYYTNKKKFAIENLNNFLKGIDKIYWINLDISLDRRNNMEFFLKDLSIPNERVVASDGKNDSSVVSNFILKDGITQKPNIYACLLSHLRAIQTFYNSGLNVALILEDDTSLSFMKYWKEDIKSILHNAPNNWEILMMSYTLGRRLTNDPLLKESNLMNEKDFKEWYVPWKHNMTSCAAYLINRKGAEKIMKIYINKKWHIDSLPHVSDSIIYKLVNTYVYKYAYFTGLNESSTLHNEHLNRHRTSTNFSKKLWKEKLVNDKDRICG